MIEKIKKKIRKFVDVRVKLIKEQQQNNAQTVFSYNQLCQLFAEDNFIPFSGWAISPNTILHVLNDISINKRKGIVEFGSGASTFYIAKLLKILKIDALFFSVESNENWANELERQLELYGLKNYVVIIYAPLEDIPPNLAYKEQKKWYNTNILAEKLENLGLVDLVLVDGPFGGSTPYARYSAIPFLKSKLTKDCSIYLDDIQRAQEKEIVQEWKEMLNSEIRIIDRYAILTSMKNFDVSPFQLRSMPL